MATDLTDRQRAEEAMRRLSLVDELTQINNRRGFVTLAEQQLKLAPRLQGRLALLFADVDGLKPINDTLGHAAGDLALQDTAAVLRAVFREGDILGRLGGDEFAMLATVAEAKDAPLLLARLEEGLAAHNHRAGRPYTLAVSVGCVVADPAEGLSLPELLELADAAMYERKRHRQDQRAGAVPARLAD